MDSHSHEHEQRTQLRWWVSAGRYRCICTDRSECVPVFPFNLLLAFDVRFSCVPLIQELLWLTSHYDHEPPTASALRWQPVSQRLKLTSEARRANREVKINIEWKWRLQSSAESVTDGCWSFVALTHILIMFLSPHHFHQSPVRSWCLQTLLHLTRSKSHRRAGSSGLCLSETFSNAKHTTRVSLRVAGKTSRQ